MITSARIREDLLAGRTGLDLGASKRRHPQAVSKIKKTVKPIPNFAPANCNRSRWRKSSVPEFPGERLLVCLNPRPSPRAGRKKREQLLRATETILTEIAAAARRHQSNSANRDRTIKRLGTRSQPPQSRKALRTSPSPTATCCGHEISSESTTKPNSTASM